MTKILNRLREETSTLHREIEKDNLAGKIMDHSISLEEYKLLLFQNYIAYDAAEAQIGNYLKNYSTDKTQRLAQDLNNLGVHELEHNLDFICSNEAEAIGAAYVVEGSAMGGMLIGKEISNCPELKTIAAPLFFNGHRDSVRNWNEYLKFLRSKEFSETEIDLATSKAKETFLLFEKAFNIQLTQTD
ncbi:biliverdin-producing heme oxygenase [Christiangramia sabulilitoris]|uniref:Biliverdin-producing heme oxygenase n=1 Tax=Christiangramia sabulilitoris TaxID=2583991 RepID=A0A550I287_9FLAO|nr:biliverdin-producing heme oxygenase [Christiangramia sabulilitoris]TRO65071.1 biliverdin-producing heme oxygenase [Christiangramia sabulilitoris]